MMKTEKPWYKRWWIIALLLFTALVIWGEMGKEPAVVKNGSLSSPPTTAPVVEDNPLLELKSWNWGQTEGGSHAEANGIIKNISGQSLKNVTAVVSFYTKDGTFITSDEALIDYNPILSGQTSPFKVLETWNPAMSRASVEFKFLMGGTINTKYPK